MFDVQLLDPNGYNVPGARLPIASLAEKPAAVQALLTVEAPRHAAESGVGYDARWYTVRTQPALLPTDPQALAQLIPTVDAPGQPPLLDRLTAQYGNARQARLLLADAYMAYAAQLRTAGPSDDYVA